LFWLNLETTRERSRGLRKHTPHDLFSNCILKEKRKAWKSKTFNVQRLGRRLSKKLVLQTWIETKSVPKSLSLDTTSTSETTLTVVTEGRAASILEFVFLAVTSFWALVGSLVCSRDNLRWQTQVAAKVFNSFVSQIAVVVLPGEGDAHISLRLQRLHQHENLQVRWSLNLGVLGGLRVFLDYAYTLLEEISEDSDTIFLGDEHFVDSF